MTAQNFLQPADDLGFRVDYKHPYLWGASDRNKTALNATVFNSRKLSGVFTPGALGARPTKLPCSSCHVNSRWKPAGPLSTQHFASPRLLVEINWRHTCDQRLCRLVSTQVLQWSTQSGLPCCTYHHMEFSRSCFKSS